MAGAARWKMSSAPTLPEVFSAAELARVTGLPVRQIRALTHTAVIPTVDGALVARHDALRACRALLDGRLTAPVGVSGSGLLSRDRTDSTRNGRSTSVSLRAARRKSAAAFDRRYIPAAGVAPRSNTAGMLPRRAWYWPSAASITTGLGATPHFPYGLLVSGSVHAAVLAFVLVLTTVAVPSARLEDVRDTPPERVRLVFVADPGPGGGGGGGGRRQPTPPPQAERAGARPLSSPLPRRRPPKLLPSRPRPARPLPKPLDHEPLPPLLAPLAAVAADTRETVGLLTRVMTPPAPEAAHPGSGTGGGVGSGSGGGRGAGRRTRCRAG